MTKEEFKEIRKKANLSRWELAIKMKEKTGYGSKSLIDKLELGIKEIKPYMITFMKSLKKG